MTEANDLDTTSWDIWWGVQACIESGFKGTMVTVICSHRYMGALLGFKCCMVEHDE